MIVSSPLYPQAATQAAVATSSSGYGTTPSFLLTTQSGSSGSLLNLTDSSTSSGSFLEQITAFASQIAESVYNSVMEFFGPMLGVSSSPSTGNLTSETFVPYASTTTKKPKTFIDKLISWFGSIGTLGNNISKGIKAGREVLDGVTSAFTWLQENSLGDTIANIGTGISESLSGIGSSISNAATSIWDWLFGSSS